METWMPICGGSERMTCGQPLIDEYLTVQVDIHPRTFLRQVDLLAASEVAPPQGHERVAPRVERAGAVREHYD